MSDNGTMTINGMSALWQNDTITDLTKRLADVEQHGRAIQSLTHKTAELYGKLGDAMVCIANHERKLANLESATLGPQPIDPNRAAKLEARIIVLEGLCRNMGDWLMKLDPPEPELSVDALVQTTDPATGQPLFGPKPQNRDVGQEMAEGMVGVVKINANSYVSVSGLWVKPIDGDAERSAKHFFEVIADAINRAVADERARIVRGPRKNCLSVAAEAVECGEIGGGK